VTVASGPGPTLVRDVIRGDVTFANESIEDFALLRSNGTPMFLLANVVDDIEMAITHVVRGEEHLPNTPKQQLLWEALGKEPPVWAHVPVLVNEQRKKLSKRRDKVAIEQYRDEGYLADAMVNYLMTLGWSPATESGESEIVPWAEIERSFRLEDVTHSPAYFDLKKLAAFNGDYIRMMSVGEFVAASTPWLPAHYDKGVVEAMAPHIQTRVATLAEVPGMVDFLMGDPHVDEDSWAKAMHQPWSRAVLAETVEAYNAAEWNHEALKGALEAVAARHELKLGKAQAPVRVAVTGRSVGPPLFESLEVLGRDETIKRLDAAVARIPRD
jgi:glutamyl-tRNA synthetase